MGTATEFEKLRKRRRIRKVFKRTTWLMILSVLAAAAFVLWSLGSYLDMSSRLSNYLSSMRPGGGYPVALDDMNVYELIPMGEDVAVVSRSGNYIYNQNGARLYTGLNHYSNPVTKGAGGKLITYDAVGQEVQVTTKTELLYTLERQGKIFDADICETGAFAIAESAKGSLGVVTAYSAKNEEMYRWETSGGYLYKLALNIQGTMFAAASINSEQGQLASTLHFHQFSASQEVARQTLPDELVLSLKWNDERRLQVITDKRLHVYDEFGTELFVGDTPADITGFENSPQGVIYLISGDSRAPGGATVTGYDSTLRRLGSWSTTHKVFALQYYTGRLLILTEGKLYLADRNLTEIREREGLDNLTAVCGIGNTVYGLTGDGLIRQGL